MSDITVVSQPVIIETSPQVYVIDVSSVGAQGAKGNTGQGFTYRNAWVSGTSYAAYDVVTYSGSTYVCILAVSGSTIPSSDSSHWTLTASKGDTGTAATVGIYSPTITGAAGSNANVTNQGNSSAALFQFSIPRGDKGLAGIVASATAPSDTTVVWLDTASAAATITNIDGGSP